MALLTNVGSTDKMIRIVLGVIVLAIAFTQLGGFATTMGILASVVGAVLIATGLFNFCPLYKLLGIQTKPS